MYKLIIPLIFLTSCVKEQSISVKPKTPETVLKINYDFELDTIPKDESIYFEIHYNNKMISAYNYGLAKEELPNYIAAFVYYISKKQETIIEKTSYTDSTIIIHSFNQTFYENKSIEVYYRN